MCVRACVYSVVTVTDVTWVLTESFSKYRVLSTVVNILSDMVEEKN